MKENKTIEKLREEFLSLLKKVVEHDKTISLYNYGISLEYSIEYNDGRKGFWVSDVNSDNTRELCERLGYIKWVEYWGGAWRGAWRGWYRVEDFVGGGYCSTNFMDVDLTVTNEVLQNYLIKKSKQ